MEEMKINKGQGISEGAEMVFAGLSMVSKEERIALIHYLGIALLGELGVSMMCGESCGEWSAMLKGETAQLLKVLAEKDEEGFKDKLRQLVIELCI